LTQRVEPHHAAAVHAQRAQVGQHQVVVGAAV
jgi:hypothetical protein